MPVSWALKRVYISQGIIISGWGVCFILVSFVFENKDKIISDGTQDISVGNTRPVGCFNAYRWVNIRLSPFWCGDLCCRVSLPLRIFPELLLFVSFWAFLRRQWRRVLLFWHLRWVIYPYLVNWIALTQQNSGTPKKNKARESISGSASTAGVRSWVVL